MSVDCRRASDCPISSACGRVTLDSCVFCPLGETCSCLSAEQSALCSAQPCLDASSPPRGIVPCGSMAGDECQGASHCALAATGHCEALPCVRLRSTFACEAAGCSWSAERQACRHADQVHTAASSGACAAQAYDLGFACFACFAFGHDQGPPGVCLVADTARAGDEKWVRSYCPRGYGAPPHTGGRVRTCVRLSGAGTWQRGRSCAREGARLTDGQAYLAPVKAFASPAVSRVLGRVALPAVGQRWARVRAASSDDSLTLRQTTRRAGSPRRMKISRESCLCTTATL